MFASTDLMGRLVSLNARTGVRLSDGWMHMSKMSNCHQEPTLKILQPCTTDDG